MGMFDYLYYRGEEYQTKDTPAQALDDYRIEQEQLWYLEYESEWTEGEGQFGGSLVKSNQHWILCDDFDGVIRFYREDRDRGGHKQDAWIEYEALFMDGNMIKLTQTEGVEPLTAWYLQGIKDLKLKDNK